MGTGLNDNETFSYKLHQYTNRFVYNLGIGGHSPRTSLYILRNNELLGEIFQKNYNVDYIIYTYIEDHKRRLFVNVAIDDIFFFKKKEINKKIYLKQEKLCPLKQSFIYKNFKELICTYKTNYYSDDVFSLFCLYMKEINKEIKNKFKNKYGEPTQFIIMLYGTEYNENDNWAELEKDGIIIIKTNDITKVNLSDDNYKFLDNHPNAKAWEVIVPALAKELNL